MKKIFTYIGLVVLALILQWCSSWSVKTTVDDWVNALIKKDQEKQQWFVLTKEALYEVYYKKTQHIDLRQKGLVAIPDLCSLLDPVDQPKVKSINLMNNNITLANQDLSCLTWLETLNLSYNDIEVIGDLWTLPSLKELQLQKNNITSTKGFPEFPVLEKLNLSYNKLKKLSDPENFKTLVTLELVHNELEELVGLEKIEKLKELKVEFNKLKDIKSIDDLMNLEIVTTKWNELKASLIEKLEEINESYVEKEFWSVWWKIWEVLIDEVESSINNDKTE